MEEIDICNNDNEVKDSKISLENIIDDFICEAYCIFKYVDTRLADVLQQDIKNLQDESDKLESLKQFISYKEEKGEGEDEAVQEAFRRYIITKNRNKYSNNSTFCQVIIKSLYLNIFSIFDEFIGEFLEGIFILRPELLRSSEKQISIAEVLECKDLNNFKSKIIDKEIDSMRRESYVEQFKLLEKKFDMKLRQFDHWSEFVEITQRRNLIMHCGGIVSDQYITICSENGCKNLPNKNAILKIDSVYLKESIIILIEVGIKLVHVTWRKLFTTEVEKEEEHLNNVIFNFLNYGEYELSMEIGKFALSIKNIKSKQFELFYVINLCITYKVKGKNNEIEILLNKYDWSTMKKEFCLAKHILLDEYDKIYDCIIRIGTDSEYFSDYNYATFPIFKFVFNNENFVNGFQTVFKVNFSEFLSNIANEYIVEKENFLVDTIEILDNQEK